MRPPLRGPRLVLLVVCAVAAGCGKKGPPLPPLARVPAAPAEPQAVRVGDEVFVSFAVPTANVSGQTPADLAAIELYAFTGAAPPPGPDPTDHAAKVGTYPVQPPLPPAPPPADGEPASVAKLPPGFTQGARAVVRETLTPETLQPTPLAPGASQDPDPAADPAPDEAPGPLVAPSQAAPLKRYYFLIARSARDRASAPTAPVAVPVAPASGPPRDVTIEYSDQSVTVRWSPSPDARTAPVAADPDRLPSKPLQPPSPPTRYLVFEEASPASPPDPYTQTVPSPLAPEPVASTEFTIKGPVQYGQQRCFVVRAVDTIANTVSVGAASDPACVTPVDTFPPAPPQRLAAIAGADVINLIWEPNTEPDLAGYIVLRGAAPGDTLQALTPTPIRETTYRDQSVRPGERYVYAVVAVDNATPQNVSGQSNRVEESSRAPR